MDLLRIRKVNHLEYEFFNPEDPRVEKLKKRGEVAESYLFTDCEEVGGKLFGKNYRGKRIQLFP
ncbi:MAG: hypothetical protein J7K87_03915 [Candidatus Aenigmarchaeota archaeon]|nr:hypothetical protein [Candidatus Aenigmarchaeota archaeon]